MRALLVYIFLLTCVSSSAQYARFLFRNPLGIPMHLIANFGEVRNDHYHMGLDLRTQLRENLPVYAAAEGYVSRVTIEAGGYGKCIYITHPNGYTSLYAHLNDFFPALRRFVEHRQYHDRQWEVDMRFPRGQFPVSKGQYIALSGATGGVEGPHLHFEVRDTRTGNNINPLFLGFPVKDDRPPFIYNLYLYDRNYSTYSVDPARIAIRQEKTGYTTKDSVIRTGSGKVSFGISAEDVANGSGFRFGIYGAELWLDSVLQFDFELREFGYEESRYVNASIDYKKWLQERSGVQHLSRLPGNHLFVKEGQNDGVIVLKDTLVHKVMISVRDAAANESVLEFNLQWAPSLQEERFFTQETVKLVPGRPAEVEMEDIKLSFPRGAVYDTVNFRLSRITAEDSATVYHVHEPSVPLHEPYTVTIASAGVDTSGLVMRMTGRSVQVVKPVYRKGGLTASFDRFGTLQLVKDTIPPIVSATWADSSVFAKNSSITFTVKDAAGAIENVRGEIDGQWVLFARKGNTCKYKFDDYCGPGAHVLKVTAADIAGNTITRSFNFVVKENIPVRKTVKKK